MASKKRYKFTEAEYSRGGRLSILFAAASLACFFGLNAFLGAVCRPFERVHTVSGYAALTQPLAHPAASPARKTGAAALLVLFIGQFWALLPLYHRFFCSGFPEYMILFSLAYLIGRFRVYEQLAARLRLPGLCCALCIAALLALRWFWAKEPGQCDCDIFIAPLLLFALVEWMRAPFFEARLAPAARFLGKYSTFIWLSHTFWIYYYFQPVVLLPRYSILIYLWSVLLSLLTAMALSWIYGRCVEKGVRKITARLEM